jgi:glycosyltransferase involved in cell wall biosynthesis
MNLSRNDPRIQVFTHPFFPNEDFQIYLNACDVVTLPFTEVLTSGTAITALGFGKPVILPALGCLPELINDGAGILYDPRDSQNLGEAMLAIRHWDLGKAGAAALECARVLDWKGIAEKVNHVYRS